MKALNFYRIFDLLVACNRPLPELPEAGPGTPDLQVEFCHAPMRATPSQRWAHHWHDPCGEITLSLAKTRKAFVLRSPELADFRINSDCSRIEIMADPATPAESIRHLLLDQVLPRVVAQRGRPVLHASAVNMNNAVVAFMGDTGAGKSTIATWFDQQGHCLLTDDCLALDAGPAGVRIIASYAGARLWDDSPALSQISATELSPVAHYSDKLRLHLTHCEPQQALDLTAVLVLAPENPVSGGTMELTPLTGAEAVMALVRHSFQLDITDHQRCSAQLTTLSEIVNKGLPIFQLTYPHKPEALAGILERVSALISGAGQEASAGS